MSVCAMSVGVSVGHTYIRVTCAVCNVLCPVCCAVNVGVGVSHTYTRVSGERVTV